MKIGLYFGSYNPIHIGHLIVANSMLEVTDIDEVWFVISPHSPFKNAKDLASEEDRKKMVEFAINGNDKFKISTVEFKLPKPSFTIYTLGKLIKNNPLHEFNIIMGADNLIHFHKWKAYQDILDLVDIQVYARSMEEEIPEEWQNHNSINIHTLPLINVSSTRLRKKAKNGESVKYWLRDQVEQYIIDKELYKKEED